MIVQVLKSKDEFIKLLEEEAALNALIFKREYTPVTGNIEEPTLYSYETHLVDEAVSVDYLVAIRRIPWKEAEIIEKHFHATGTYRIVEGNIEIHRG